jgi:uncharacterized protein (TIGR02145 family)
VSSGKLCPKGWHIPRKVDWNLLIDQLGGIMCAGGKLKVIGTDYWTFPNIGATNSSKFNALPSGIHRLGSYRRFKYDCYWWSTTESDGNNVFTVSLEYGTERAVYSYRTKDDVGMSVRCIKDIEYK